MRKQLGALAAGAALLIGVGATNAGAAAVSGAQIVRTITYGNTPPNTRRVVAAGPIMGLGSERIAGPMTPLPDGSTRVKLVWSFPGGDVNVTLIAFQDFQGEPVPPVCDVVADVHGTYALTGGTGAYAGVGGGGTFTGVGQVFAVFDVSTRQCSMDQANLFLNQKTYTGTTTLG